MVQSKDIKFYAGCPDEEKFPYPIIEDKSRVIALRLGMLDKDELDSEGMPLTARGVYVVDPNKKFRLSMLYPARTGRNFDEIFRIVDSLQVTDKAKVATLANWKMGDECMLLPTVPWAEVAQRFPQGVNVMSLPSGKNYLRKTACPKVEQP